MPLSRRVLKLSLWLLCCSIFSAAPAAAQQAGLPDDVRARVDDLARQVLNRTGVPSASVSILKDGRVVYAQAFGTARFDPPTPATPDMRYSIGSISKQFTAAAVLLLAEEGKVSLDDKVSKYVSGLTRGDEVTIRQILSHTSGYQDYWPHDYVPPMMLKPITAQGILDRWARIPLDFDPGTQWQYSNTNYVIAGLVIEKASGKPLLQFLSDRIFKPLGMKSVADVDRNALPPADAAGYFRYALGPPRLAPKEGPGWLFAIAELAMTTDDLQKWNLSVIRRSLLKPESYKALETEVRLKNGEASNYALGLSLNNFQGRRVLQHGGEVSGFTASNAVLPDDGIAVAVLTNLDAAGASGQIAQGILRLLMPPKESAGPAPDATVRKVLEGFGQGKIDRSLFTDNANSYFTDQAVKDFAESVSSLGSLEMLSQASASKRGGMNDRVYTAKYQKKTLSISIYEMPDGRFEQFLIRPQ